MVYNIRIDCKFTLVLYNISAPYTLFWEMAYKFRYKKIQLFEPMFFEYNFKLYSYLIVLPLLLLLFLLSFFLLVLYEISMSEGKELS